MLWFGHFSAPSFSTPPKLLCFIHVAVSDCCNGPNSGMDLVLLMNSATISLSSASSPIDPKPSRCPGPILCPQNMLQLWAFLHLHHPKPPLRFLLLRALWGDTNMTDCLKDWGSLSGFYKDAESIHTFPLALPSDGPLSPHPWNWLISLHPSFFIEGFLGFF